VIKRKIYKCLFVALLFSLIGLPVLAQEEVDTLFNESSRTLVAIPLVNNTPTLQVGFGGIAMYFFKLNTTDTISPPSTIMFYGLYSTNKSHILLPAVKLYWQEDKNRLSVGPGNMRINNNFLYEEDGRELRLVFSEIRTFVTAVYSRKVIGNFYLGLLYLGTQTNYKFDQGSQAENDFTENFFKSKGIVDNFVSSIGLNITYDSRDYVYYPTKGLMLSIRPKLNAGWLGSDNDYVDTDYNLTYYQSFAKNKVLAIGVSGGFATGDIPFDGYQNYGVRNSLRGYAIGKYKGPNMVALQAEYRWRFYKKFGVVFFAGTGSIWGTKDSNLKFSERDWLPSAGIGARYMISAAKKINIRLDYAWGVDGNEGLYFGIMEAF
jgi:outer membrane protein assembly factor BamA